MTSPKLVQWQVDMVAAVYELSLVDADPADAMPILKLMRLLCPHLPQLPVAEANMLLRQRDFAGARPLLEHADTLLPRHPTVKTMLALCLFGQHDPLWQSYANQALALDPAPHLRAVVESLAQTANVTLEAAATQAASGAELGLSSHGMRC